MSVEPPDTLPPFSMQRLPITYAIPYNFRWRVNEIKLMLNDLQEIQKKHGVLEADFLYNAVKVQCRQLCIELTKIIFDKQEWRKKYEQDKENSEQTF